MSKAQEVKIYKEFVPSTYAAGDRISVDGVDYTVQVTGPISNFAGAIAGGALVQTVQGGDAGDAVLREYDLVQTNPLSPQVINRTRGTNPNNASIGIAIGYDSSSSFPGIPSLQGANGQNLILWTKQFDDQVVELTINPGGLLQLYRGSELLFQVGSGGISFFGVAPVARPNVPPGSSVDVLAAAIAQTGLISNNP